MILQVPQIGETLIEQWGLVGILIVGFSIVSWRLWKMYEHERAINDKMSVRVVELMTIISELC